MKTKWRPWACHHEAGHCVARWYVGAVTDLAEVFDDEARAYGITVGTGVRAIGPAAASRAGADVPNG